MTKARANIGRLFSIVLGAIAAGVPATAYSADVNTASGVLAQTYEFDFQAGPLSRALKVFRDNTGVSIVFDSRLVDNIPSPVFRATLSAENAMVKLLDGTQLQYKKINQENWVIVAQDVSSEHPVVAIAPDQETPPPERILRDEIIVTASYQTPAPVVGTRSLYTLDGEQIAMEGAINVSEPILELPSTVSSVTAANTALLLSSGGLNLTDMRGLGANRSLVLVNGRRFVRTSGGNGDIFGVDLNSIPTAFVERIEIVNQAAGAALGTDAVGGAVNIVTRNDIDGVAITLDGGVSQRGDAEEFALSVLAGTTFSQGRGRFLAGLTYAQEPSLLVQERPRLTQPFGFSLNGRSVDGSTPGAVFGPGFGGSTFTPEGAVSAVTTQAGEVFFSGSSFERLAFSPDGTTYSPFVGSLNQFYDYTTDFSALPEIERLIGYANGAYEISDTHTLYAEAHFAETDVASQIAPSPVAATRGRNPLYGDGVFVPIDNPFIPVGLVNDLEAAVGEPLSGIVLRRRFAEIGPRKRRINRQTFQLITGIEGVLAGEWRYDVSYQYGRNRTHDISSGSVDRQQLNISLDATTCASAPGCSPINVFGSQNISPAQAEFIRADSSERIFKTREQFAQIKVSGPLYNYGDQTAALSAGIEHRREALSDEPELLDPDELGLGEFFFPGAEGNVAFTDFFVNANAPILVDADWARLIELGGAYRLTKRHGGEAFSSISGNARWLPFEGVEFHTHILHGGRAPNMAELFGAGPNYGVKFQDPCDFLSLTAETQGNCSAAGPLAVPAGFEQIPALLHEPFTGNPQLESEKVNAQLYGISVSAHSLFPDFPGTLTLGADWRLQRVSNAVTVYSGAEAIFDCFNSENLSSVFCGVNPATGNPIIQRDPVSQQITTVETTMLNGGELHVSGLDGRLQFETELNAVPLADFLTVDFLYTYTHRSRIRELFDAHEQQLEGRIEFPRHQLQATASIGTERLKTVWSVRRRGRGYSFGRQDVPEAQAPAVTNVDMSLQLRPTDNMILYAGIENLFDTDAPIVPYGTGNTYYEYYDVIGRRFFAGIKAEF